MSTACRIKCGLRPSVRNITINKSLAKQKERRKKRKFVVHQKFARKISSSLKIRKSPGVKISREEHSLVAQFATYRPVLQSSTRMKDHSALCHLFPTAVNTRSQGTCGTQSKFYHPFYVCPVSRQTIHLKQR